MNREQQILFREHGMKLFLPLHQDDDVEESRYRASGEMYCTLCACQYRYHPFFEEHTYNGEPIDHRLCNGDVVHL